MGRKKIAVWIGCMAVLAFAKTAQAADSYEDILDGIEEDTGANCYYALYDLNNDNSEELIVLSGTCEADYIINFYTMSGDGTEVYDLGYVAGAHTQLYEAEPEEGIYIVMGYMGYQKVTRIYFGENETKLCASIYKTGETTEYYSNDKPIDLDLWDGVLKESKNQNSKNLLEQANVGLTVSQLQEVGGQLGVPESMAVEYVQGECYYWDAGECYAVYVQVMKDGDEVIASATVNADTGELLKDIWMYTP